MNLEMGGKVCHLYRNIINIYDYPGIYLTEQYIAVILLFFFSVRLLSVLLGHSVFSSPPQRPMTSDFEGFSTPDFIHYIYFPI